MSRLVSFIAALALLAIPALADQPIKKEIRDSSGKLIYKSEHSSLVLSTQRQEPASQPLVPASYHTVVNEALSTAPEPSFGPTFGCVRVATRVEKPLDGVTEGGVRSD